MTFLPQKATEPTMYFVGVTTSKSSIMNVFPRWVGALGVDAVLRGIDVEIHAPAEHYRQVVEFIKNDPLSSGALVTTHKIDLLTAARDMFDGLDEYAEILGEVSSISKREGQLIGHAKDPISSGLALEAFLPKDWWKETSAEALIFGAGGSALAVSMYMMDPRHAENRPSKVVVTNRSKPRLEEMQRIHEQLDYGVPCEYHYCPTFEENDRVLAAAPPCSLVINATGLGKDRPGSPITDAAVMPEKGLAWDFNYRGDLKFLEQARRQEQQRQLVVEDGWIYFIHGWTQVIAEVFHLEIDAEKLDELDRLASEVRGQ
jgi:shikimate dehydrogenase